MKKAQEKLASEKADKSDLKSKATVMKVVIKDFALKANVGLG